MNFADYSIDLSKHDEKIVKANPNNSIEELMILGLTDKGVHALRTFQEGIKEYAPKQALKPAFVKQGPITNGGRMAATQLVYNSRTGMTVRMDAKAANAVLGRLNPQRNMGSTYGKTYGNAANPNQH